MGKPKFAIIGCGTLGTALGRLLFQAGYPVAGVASRTEESAKKAADILETDDWSTSPFEITKKADLVFITTPDDLIAPVAEKIAENGGYKPESIVLHCSGALASDILDPVRKAGAYAGSMHPLQSFAGAKPGVNPFEGILVSVEGDSVAKEIARELIANLGAHHARVRSDAKTLYHAAAVVASNYLVTIMGMALEFNRKAGISHEESLLGLLPLVQGTLKNIENQGIPKALTGPIERGDISTVLRHMQEIEDKTGDYIELYKTLGKFTAKHALDKGSIDAETAEKFKKMFED